MKKILLLSLLAVFLSGCTNKNVDNNVEPVNKIINITLPPCSSGRFEFSLNNDGSLRTYKCNP